MVQVVARVVPAVAFRNIGGDRNGSFSNLRRKSKISRFGKFSVMS